MLAHASWTLSSLKTEERRRSHKPFSVCELSLLCKYNACSAGESETRNMPAGCFLRPVSTGHRLPWQFPKVAL